MQPVEEPRIRLRDRSIPEQITKCVPAVMGAQRGAASPLHAAHPLPLPSCSFYKANHVQKFSYSRPFKKGPKDPDNEFAVSADGDPGVGGGQSCRVPWGIGSAEEGNAERLDWVLGWEGSTAMSMGRGGGTLWSDGSCGTDGVLPAEHVDRADHLRDSLPTARHPALVCSDLHHHGEERVWGEGGLCWCPALGCLCPPSSSVWGSHTAVRGGAAIAEGLGAAALL